jgi:hypothetical protein
MKLNSKGGALIRATIDDYRHETHKKHEKDSRFRSAAGQKTADLIEIETLPLAGFIGRFQ